MVSAMGLGLDDQRAALAGDLGPEARSGDPAADNHHVEITHRCRGYELESHAV